MADIHTWAKLAAYVVSIGVGLEFAHRLYWALSRWTMTLDTEVANKTVMSSAFACIPLLTAIFITGVFCKFVDDSPLSSLGIGWQPQSLLNLSSGVVVGGACVAAIFVAGCSTGWFRVAKSPFVEDTSRSVSIFCGASTDMLSASVFEELIMRGYIFTLLFHSYGMTVAVYGSALIFSLFHVVKHPQLPILFSINTVVFGVVVAYARAISGSLWLPIGLHFGWNMAMGPIFGLPCAGRQYESGLLTCTVEGPGWVTGGYYSPAAGVLGTVALIIATAALLAVVPLT